MGHKQQSTESVTGPKKRRRVGFAASDTGVEANECIKIYLVSSKDEVESTNGYCIDPIDLNHFFNDDGKIYGYQNLKIVIWISSISFHAYADISFDSQSDRGKGITDLKAALQDIFGETLLENKDEFFQTFSTDGHYIKSVVSNGEIMQQKISDGNCSNGNSDPNTDAGDVEVIHLVVNSMAVGHLYSRLVPLVLLLVDGSNPIDVTDSSWELYVVVQKTDVQGECIYRLLGFAAVYRFYHYPDSSRLRLSQILILPPYQRKGYGRLLLEVLNNVAISKNIYDFTIEEPVDSLQHIRNYIDIHRLFPLSSVESALEATVSQLKEANLSKRTQTSQFLPPLNTIEDVRKNLKINKRQFIQCWEILIYLLLDPIDKYMENYRTFVSDRVKAEIIGKDSGSKGKVVVETPTDYDGEMSFVMYKSQDGEVGNVEVEENQGNLEQQLKELVDERMKEIESIAQKVRASRA